MNFEIQQYTDSSIFSITFDDAWNTTFSAAQQPYERIWNTTENGFTWPILPLNGIDDEIEYLIGGF